MPNLKKIELETKKHIGLCKIHGKYESVKSNIMGKWVGGKCLSCTADYEKSELKPCNHLEPLPKRFNQCSFKNFVSDDKNKTALNFAYQYANKFKAMQDNGGSMIFYGTCGTGKTHLACAIANHIVSEKKGNVLYSKVYDVTASVKNSWSGKGATESEVIKQYTKPDLLIIDEVGVQFGSEAEQMILFRILNKRYEDIKPTIIVSNLDEGGLTKFLGERLIDRMYEGGGGMVAFNWESHRRNKK